MTKYEKYLRAATLMTLPSVSFNTKSPRLVLDLVKTRTKRFFYMNSFLFMSVFTGGFFFRGKGRVEGWGRGGGYQ